VSGFAMAALKARERADEYFATLTTP